MTTPPPGQTPDPFAKPGPGQPPPGAGYPQPGQGYPPAPGYGEQGGYPPNPGYGDPNAGYPPNPGYGDPNAGYPPNPGYGDPNAGYPQPGGYAPGPGFPPAPGYGPGYPYGADPSAPFGRHPMTGEPLSDKDKLTAGLLQILLGGVGAGRWYLGDYGIAVAQLLTCGGLGIWSLIDGVMMLTGNVRDKFGRPLRD